MNPCPTPKTTGLHPALLVLATLPALLAPPHPATAQPPPATPPPLDLTTLFDLGHLLLDENGDSVPDRLGATLVLAPEPTTAERVAAAEIAARLGFETMALDLPLRRGLRPGQVGILIGHGALAPLGLSPADFGVHTPAPGTPPTVATLTTPSSDRWVAVLGGDDDALLRAARLLSGSLPHIRSLSGPSIADVGEAINEWLAAGDSMAQSATFSYPRVSVNGSGDDIHLVAELSFAADSLTADALDRLGALAREGPDADSTENGSADLGFRNLATVTVTGGGWQVELPALTPSSPSGGRPGGGGGTPDLADLYASGGFLGGGDIPNSISVIVVPGEGAEGVPELAARLGLETTGFTVPLVKTTDEIESASREPTMVLVGSDHPLIAELADSGKVAPAELPPGHGLIEVVPDAFGSRSAVVVTGSDHAGATMATRRLAEVFPGVSKWDDGTPTFSDIEEELWGTLSGYTPGGQAAIGLYKLDRIVAGLADEDIASAEILVSAEKAPPGLADIVRARATALGTENITVTIDNRDVREAAPIFDDEFGVPSEIVRFRDAFEARVLPGLTAGEPVHLHARLSEPPEIRQSVANEARRRLIAAGADPDATTVEVLSAFKQGFFWLTESVAPRLADQEIGEIVIEFLRNEPPGEWPQQAMLTPLRWLHEIFPIDEVLVADLGT